MQRRSRSSILFFASSAALLVAFAALLAACADKSVDEKDPEPAPSATASYTVRGVVKSVAGDGASIMIHHEAIPDFVGRQGKKVGMMSMSMPFGVAAGVSLAKVSPGSPVEFAFSVDFKKDPPTEVTRITVLPADTELSITGH